jgi:hypothetical protein
MCAVNLLRFLVPLATVAVVLGSSGIASAGWITLKNDTGKTITVQEISVVNGQTKRGKATNLLAGESLREFIPGPTTKRLEVYEGQNPSHAVWNGDLNCKSELQTFSVSVTAGKVTVGPVTANPATPPPKK